MTEKMANPGPAGEETRRKVIWIEVGVTDSFVVAIANNKIRPLPPPCPRARYLARRRPPGAERRAAPGSEVGVGGDSLTPPL